MRIVEKGPLTVVGLQVTAPWIELWTAMPRTWATFFARRHEIPHCRDATSLDVSLDRGQDGIYTQLVGAEVTGPGDVPGGMVVVRIPSQRYLYHRHEGPLPAIAASFEVMYAWAGTQRLTLDEFKLDMGYTPAGDERQHDLFIRLRS